MNDEVYLKKLGMKLKILRSLKGFSQDDVANALDVDKSYYSKVERGLTNVTIIYLKHLAEFFKVELVELVNGDMSDLPFE